MKLYELTWEIICGEFSFVQSEMRAFNNMEEAEKCWYETEYKNNTGKELDPYPADDERELETIREKAREDASFEGRYYRCCSVAESPIVYGPDYQSAYRLVLGEEL